MAQVPGTHYQKVDRSTVLGNQFRMRHESQRDSVCDLYASFAKGKLKHNEVYRNAIAELVAIAQTKPLVLLCWCHPKRCHANTIKNLIEEVTFERFA